MYSGTVADHSYGGHEQDNRKTNHFGLHYKMPLQMWNEKQGL